MYSLGVAPEDVSYSADGLVQEPPPESDFRLPGTVEKVVVPWPPLPVPTLPTKCWAIPDRSMMLPLPLNNLPMPMPATAHRPSMARAARTRAHSSRPKARDTRVDFNSP